MRDSFIFYNSFLLAIDELDDVMKLKLYDAISHYALRGEEPDLSGIPKAVFSLIRPQLDANLRKFENGKKGAEFGKLGGRPKKEETPNNPLGVIKENPKKTPNVNVNDNDNDNVNDIYPPIIPQMGEVSEKKILKLDLSNPNKAKEKSCAKKEKEIQQELQFDKFWDDYDKKVGDKEKIKKKWDKLTDRDKQTILDYIPKYKLSQPDKKFRKNPETFLNNKSWLDEIITHNNVFYNNQDYEHF